jgi:hypothetical protein
MNDFVPVVNDPTRYTVNVQMQRSSDAVMSVENDSWPCLSDDWNRHRGI